MEVREGSDLCFPELHNTSCRKPTLSPSNVVFLCFLMSTMSVLTVTLNLLVIISVSHFRRLHTPTNLLLLSLAVSDFTVGLVVLPSEIMRTTACWFLGEFMCSFSIYVNTVTVGSSVGNMVMISADRYVAICDPLHYPSRLTLTRVKTCISLCWLCLAFYCSIYVKDDLRKDTHTSCYGECVFAIDYITGITDLVLNFIVPVSTIIVLYLRVFVVAVSQARAMRSHITGVSLQQSGTVTSKKSELKAARTLGVLVVVFLTCFCPYYCAALSGANSPTTMAFLLCLLFSNSCMNPVIYALFYPWFRKCVKHIVTLQILQPGSREANIL
ncbi:trace amine-associated receptor 6-like [Parambassis ranga]|uniref:Trace amine-associated receptor 6-like n=1 Tax=Parambassis ranga TaxID=210632 RepID=A0A6P7H442_9TELE|nr:trace amine-associated receptor 6-like [Parambassis ranga]